jgi:pyruvate dehydrogenase E1 component
MTNSKLTSAQLETLSSIETRVLWLATTIVHYANRSRNVRSGLKVGGHQASSASATSILTALFFGFLRGRDEISVKPHAAPALHAIQYLLGNLGSQYLTSLREYGGLQAYPSRHKDPVPADFSTGSVGIGATATIWRAVAHRYLAGHFDVEHAGRQIAVVGDAELDEGAIWEAIVDPQIGQLGELLWVVDVNRQSLDRILPTGAAERVSKMFDAAGWHVITLKYGGELSSIFERPGGGSLRLRLDAMSNEEYQRLLRLPARELRDRLPDDAAGAEEIRSLVSDLTNDQLTRAIRDLGGHDIRLLLNAFNAASEVHDRPSIVFAHTIKSWRLPTEGHPANHSSLLTSDQWEALAPQLGASIEDPWAPFDEASDESRLCWEAWRRLMRPTRNPARSPKVPVDFGHVHHAAASTQQALGRFFLELSRSAPEVARRVVTVSPDVASSTNLGGWINKVGVWHLSDRPDWFADDPERLLHWREGPTGQHIEVGIAEVNLVGLLGELGATWSRDGETLLPIGTIYDPFVNRALEPWSFGIYAGGQSILVGTPSGVTLAPEGGAHQSITTPSVGIAQPQCVAWEPAFAQDLEWTLLHALSCLGKSGGSSSYFRLSTRPVAQALAATPSDLSERESRRRQVVAGGYRLVEATTVPTVTLVGMGAVMPEVLKAAEQLTHTGTATDVVCVTSADLLFRAIRARSGLYAGEDWILDQVLPADRASAIVTVLDGHPHALSFLGAVHSQPLVALGVDDFGQSGDIDDLYEHFSIDADTIAAVARDQASSVVSHS